MQYVRIEPIVEDGRHKGYSLDADPYLAALPDVIQRLPRGAGAFAADPDHYNFFGRKCVKDLKLSQAAIRDADERLSCMLEFEPYQFKHDLGLVLKYNDVTEVAIRAVGVDEETVPAAKRLGYLQLDEILPHDRGFTHEIQFTAGSIWIVAHDLSFDWA